MGLISKQALDQLSRIIRAIKIVGIIMANKIGTLDAQKIVILCTQLPICKYNAFFNGFGEDKMKYTNI